MPNPNHLHDCDIHNHHHHHAAVTHHPTPKPNPRLLSIFLKFVVMSLILSVFLLFLGLAAIILLHLLVAGSFVHRRRRQRANPHQELQDRLPPFRYTGFETPAVPADCSICLEYFKEGDFCRALPVCEHVFHAHCVDRWITKVPNCPICRSRVRLETGGSSDSMISDDECKFLWAIGVGR